MVKTFYKIICVVYTEINILTFAAKKIRLVHTNKHKANKFFLRAS